MILPDVNLLLYAYDENSEFHRSSAQWLETVLSSEQVFFTWQTITAFLRIITHPSASRNPLTIEKAVHIVNEWLRLENTNLVSLKKDNWKIFSSTLIDGQATGNLVMDAHIAAVALSCGAKVASTDRDLFRFPGLTVSNPLKS